MTQLERLKLRITDNVSDVLLEDILESAKNVILSRRYPFLPEHEYPEDVEYRYKDLQIRIAVEMYNKQGVEGQTSHSELGVNRTYESANISESLLKEITPKVGVV